MSRPARTATAAHSKTAHPKTANERKAPVMATATTAALIPARAGRLHRSYLRYEVLRTFRNRRFLVFSLAFPLVLFFTIASENRHVHLDGISFPLYYMTGMASWGSLVAVISSGGRIAGERQIGWTRQIRITPLGPGSYIGAKVICAYLMAALSIAALYLAGSSLGVHLTATQWLEMTGLLLVGLVPFAVLGIVLGHAITVDATGPAIGGATTVLALLGGSWGPLFHSAIGLDLVKCIPSYWLVQAGRIALGGSAWTAQAWVVVAAWTIVLAVIGARVYLRDTARV